MTNKKQKFKVVARLFITIILALLFACSSSDNNTGEVTHDGKDLLVHFATPKALIGSLITDLKANLIIGDGSPIELVVNPDNTISGIISNVSPGVYDLVITYYVVLASLQTPLATVTKNITVEAGGTTAVLIVDSDLDKNIDADGDGYTNLAEINIGTDPHNKNDAPGGELILFSLANGSFGDSVSSNYKMKSRVGEPLNGVKKSTNFILVDGFSAY